MIDILIPVLGRPQNAAKVVASIEKATTVEHTITFLATPGDTDQLDACWEHADRAYTHVMDTAAVKGDYAYKMQKGFDLTESEFVFLGADDVDFQHGWDEEALKVARNRWHVIATNDKANGMVMRGQFGTHCLIRRSYIAEQGGTADNTPGLFLHPGYDHNFVDRELCGVAKQRDVFQFARHSVVRHMHPNWRGGENDATYDKGRRNYRADYELFLERALLWNLHGLSGMEKTAITRKRRRGEWRRR